MTHELAGFYCCISFAGRLTLAQIDVDRIETLTIDCAIDTVTGA